LTFYRRPIIVLLQSIYTKYDERKEN
jgi:hypothetical protein